MSYGKTFALWRAAAGLDVSHLDLTRPASPVRPQKRRVKLNQ